VGAADDPGGSLRHPLTRTLLALTFSAGIVDAVSFLALGSVFTANMTGNVLLLGFALAGTNGLPVIRPLVSLTAFLAGAVLGGALARGHARRAPDGLAAAIALESGLVCLAAFVALATDPEPGDLSTGAVIALLAFAMGSRTATVRAFAVPDLPTTVLTMTLTGLAADIGTDRGTAADARRRSAAVAALFCGALAGALLLQVDLAVALFAMAASSLLAGAGYVLALRRTG
jgi:uncharacterized membrane protein YoaK (UPF0700 family)